MGKLFLELVRMDSPSLREGALAARCRQELEALGFSVEEDDAGRRLGGEAGNLIATLEGDPAYPSALLLAHMDTVEAACGVRPRVDDHGTVWSDGSTALGADDKAGVAAVLAAARELATSGVPHGVVQVVLTVAEELGCQGARKLHRARLRAQMGMAFDAPGPVGSLVVAGPSQVRWEAELWVPRRCREADNGDGGSAGAAWIAEDGRRGERAQSPIRAAAQALSRLQLGRWDDDTVVSVGRFGGGKVRNGRFGSAALVGEVRTRDPSKLRPALSRVRDAFRQAAVAQGCVVEFRCNPTYDAFHFPPQHPVRVRAERAIRQAGVEPGAVAAEDGSDASILCSLGIPTINVSVGYEAHHALREHVRLHDVVCAARIALAFCVAPNTSIPVITY